MDDPQAAARAAYRRSELSKTTFPAWRDQVASYDLAQAHLEGRSYPGYPRFALPRARRRPLTSLDAVLQTRRSARQLDTALPTAKVLGRLLQYGHGSIAELGRGPVPSAGGLQALELYVVVLGADEKTPAAPAASWLPAGVYHYDRARHLLAQLCPAASRAAWHERVPSLALTPGGALLWVLVGDAARVEEKYGARATRFLLLEAGHLMQNLCLLSTSLDLGTVPLGGFLEPEISRELSLLRSDLVLYVGLCGGRGK